MLLCQEFYLENWDWFVRVFYVVDYLPIEYIEIQLEKLNFSKSDISLAVDNLTNGDNKAITFSNSKSRSSVIVIGKTSNPEEFSNSYDHEKFHLAMHIAKENNIDPYSEELAYLIGEIGFNTFKVARRFLCEHCRENLT